MITKKPSRRGMLLGVGAAIVAHSAGSSAADTFSPIASVDAGFAPDLGARLDKAVADKRVWNQHGLVVLRGNRLVLERYFEGEDEARGVGAIGRVTFRTNSMHDLRSCSKSIVGLLYGIAMQQGKVPPPEAPLFSTFPEYADLANTDGRDRLTILHVLTMTMGTDWDESSLTYADPRNSETAMDNAPDRYRSWSPPDAGVLRGAPPGAPPVHSIMRHGAGRTGQVSIQNVAVARAMVSPSAAINASTNPNVLPVLTTRGSISSHCPIFAVAR